MNETVILLVEDDRNFGMVLRDYLTVHNFTIHWEQNGIKGIEAFKSRKFDLCIFDIMMPGKDGFSLANEVRLEDPGVPFIFLTAKSLKEDMIRGFKAGADDYVTKPFDSEILLLKIRAILNRKLIPTKPESEQISVGKFEFDPRKRTIRSEGKEQKLSPRETALLKMLIDYRNTVMPRTKALKEIWKEENYFTARSMDVYVARLRKFLQEDPEISIRTIHGNGYMLET